MAYFVGLDVSVKETSVCIVERARSCGKQGWRVSRPAGGADEHHLSLQASGAGSRAAIAVAFQRSRRSWLAGDLC